MKGRLIRFLGQFSGQSTDLTMSMQARNRKKSSYTRPELLTATGMNTIGLSIVYLFSFSFFSLSPHKECLKC